MDVVSDIDGRIRIRGRQLLDVGAAENMRLSLSSISGVREIRVNLRAGSMLLIYQPGRAHREAILNRIAALPGKPQAPAVSAARNKPKKLPAARRVVKFGMLVSLAFTLLSAAFDREKLHVVSGLIYIGFLGLHITMKRRLLFV